MHIDDSESSPQFHEPHSPQRLGEDVSELLRYSDMINFHLSFLYRVTKKVIPCIDVLLRS